MRRQDEACGERPVLPAALHDLAGLDEHLGGAAVLDLELIDVAGFVHPYAAVGERLLQGERHRTGRGWAMDQIDRQVFMHHRA